MKSLLLAPNALIALIALFALSSCTRLDAPTDLKVAAFTDSSVTIEWKDWSKGEESFLIYESTKDGKFQIA